MLLTGQVESHASQTKNIKEIQVLVRPFTPAKLIEIITGQSPGVKKEHLINEPQAGIKLNILLVDDNLSNRVLGKKLIEKCGHNPVIAENGEEALKIYQAEKIDLIFMDCQMPVMDGFECTRAIRREEAGNLEKFRVPIVALTAGVLKDWSSKCLDAGMDDYIAKPVTLEMVRGAFSKWTAKK